MAEPHDTCVLNGCTLGRGHVGSHVGPRCPVCGVGGAWIEACSAWYCRGDLCDNDKPLPVPVLPEGMRLQPMPAASPLAVEATSAEQYLLDLEAEAREADERVRSDQRRACELRAMARHLRAWLDKSPPAPAAVISDRRSPNP